MEQSGGTVEVHQYPVHDTYADAPQPYGFVTIPVHDTYADAPQPYGFVTIPVKVDDHQNNTYGTEKIHDFRQCPQIVFLL